MKKINDPALIQYTLDVRETTQAELGVEMDIAQSRVSELLNGKYRFRKRHAMCLETILRREGEWPPPRSISIPV